MVELLANRNLSPKGEIPQDILNELDRLRQEIPALQRQLENTSATNTETEASSQTITRDATHSNQIRDRLNTLQQQLTEVLEQIKPYDPDFSLTQKVKPIQFAEIQGLLDQNTAILQWY